MSEPHMREIQVSGKQLVFLFMASVVVAVSVFLLGVSVGRGVREATGGTPVVPATDAEPLNGPMPSATEASRGDQTYAQSLTAANGAAAASGAPARGTEPATAASDVPEVDEPQPGEKGAKPSAPSPAPKPNEKATAAPPAKATAAVPDAPAAGGWWVQVGAYRSSQNAETQVTQLKAKGYPSVVVAGRAGGLHRVKVGPYAQKAEADRVAARLSKEQEGTKPSVSR